MDFVTYEIAKKLKEKGFREPCFATYDNDGMLGYVYYQPQNIHAVSFDDCLYYGDDVVVAPTISQVLKWLREVKRIDSGAIWDNRDGKWIGYLKEMNMPDLAGEYILHEIFDTYEQATLAVIEYILDNLMDNN